MPAANRTGRHRIAYHGRPAAPALAATTSRATSVAVSNPRPNRTPIGYICCGLVTVLVSRPKKPVHEPTTVKLTLECGLVERAALHLAEHPDDPDQDDEVERGDDVQEDT